MEKVSAVICNSYDLEEVYLAMKEAIQRIDFVIPKNKKVLIKPNIMTQNRPAQHTVTHFSLIDGLCRILAENNCNILIGDSISFYQRGLTRKAFQSTRIDRVATKYGATLIAFEDEPLIRISQGLVGLKELYIPEILLKVDMVINACKLKTHGFLRLAGAIKNLYGCLPGGYKQKIHHWVKNNEFDFTDVLIDLHRTIQPSLSIMDAIVSLDGGPTAIGRPVKTNRLLASQNAAALDVIASGMIGYQFQELPILIQAKKRGMIKNPDEINLVGNIEKYQLKRLVKKSLEQKTKKASIFVKDTYVDLFINQSKCTNCNACIKYCPVGAITLKNARTTLDSSSCINCYHCLTVCPEKAIQPNPTCMNRLIRGVRFVIRI